MHASIACVSDLSNSRGLNSLNPEDGCFDIDVPTNSRDGLSKTGRSAGSGSNSPGHFNGYDDRTGMVLCQLETAISEGFLLAFGFSLWCF